MNGKEQIFSSAIKLGMIDDWKKQIKITEWKFYFHYIYSDTFQFIHFL